MDIPTDGGTHVTIKSHRMDVTEVVSESSAKLFASSSRGPFSGWQGGLNLSTAEGMTIGDNWKQLRRQAKMSEDKPEKSEADSQPADNSKKSKADGDKSSGAKSEKAAASLDLDKLKNTTPTQVPSTPKVTTIAGTARTKVVKSAGPKVNWKFTIVGGVACMFFGWVTHIFGINAGLVLYDRFNLAYVMNKTAMGKMSEQILSDMLGVAPLSQPWLRASFISDAGEYGLTFTWYHVVNVFWHAIATGLLFSFVLILAVQLHHQQRLKLNPYHLAAATAALFACHPLACETITYLSCRSALLGTVNYFESLVFVLLGAIIENPFVKLGFILMALYTGAMAIWSNPEAVTLPVVAMFSLFIMKRPLAKWLETVYDHPFFTGIGGALCVLIPCLWLLPVQYTNAVSLFVPILKPIAYAASQIKSIVFYYLRCAVVPYGVSIDPPLTIASNFTDPFVIAGIVILAALIFAVAKLKQPIIGLGALLVLAGFLPHAIMVQPDTVADWVAYLPLAGLMIIAAYAYCWFAQINSFRATVLLGAFILTFTGLSIYRDCQWSSNFALFQSGLQFRPKSAFLHANMAMEYLKRDQIDEGEKEANLALSYKPDLVLARIAHAKVLMAKGKFEQAGKEFLDCQNAAEHEKLSSAVKTECRLGELQCLIGLRKEESATKLLGSLFTEIPGEARLMYQVALPAYEMHDYEKAFKIFDQAVSTDPSVTECWKPMAECALGLRAFEPAYTAAHNYLDQVGGPNAQLLFARTAIAAKRESEAEEILKQLVGAEPKNSKALYLLSRLYKRMGKTEDSKKYQADAVKIDAQVEKNFPLPELEGEEQSAPEGTATDTAAPKETSPAPAAPAPTPAPAPAGPTPTPAPKEAPAPTSSPAKETPAPTK